MFRFPPKAHRQVCETGGRWGVQWCRFLPILGKVLLQKIGLCRRQWCDGSRSSNTDSCRGCCSDHSGWDVLWFLDCILMGFLLLELAGVGVFPVTTTLPSCCSADMHKHTCAHMHPHCTHTQSVLLFFFLKHICMERCLSLSSSPVCVSPSTTQQ